MEVVICKVLKNLNVVSKLFCHCWEIFNVKCVNAKEPSEKNL